MFLEDFYKSLNEVLDECFLVSEGKKPLIIDRNPIFHRAVELLIDYEEFAGLDEIAKELDKDSKKYLDKLDRGE